MKATLTTAQKILLAARRLFNEKGYAATTLTEIAEAVGISQGNLTYHFPTKIDLVHTLIDQTHAVMSARWNEKAQGDVIADYVRHLIFAMQMNWENRFVQRDIAQFGGDTNWGTKNPYLAADFDELKELLQRLRDTGYFLAEPQYDAETLLRTLWINGRYWMEHLRELEGIQNITPAEMLRGIEHHIAVLSPSLKKSARVAFKRALEELEFSDSLFAENTNA
jgi:AcrR family transcriptional regulator